MATTGMASNAVEAIQALAKGLGTGDRDTFEFRAGPYLYGELRVVSFVLIEGLSELFKAEVVAVSAVGPAVMLPALVGQPACLSVRLLDGTTRDVQGVTSDVALLGHNAIDAHYRYRVTVRPRLWLLTKRRNSRIFQDQSAQNTVNTILAEHHVPARWNLSRELLKRDYCTQYEETDFAFVARLLSEEGVFFSFDHPSGVIDARRPILWPHYNRVSRIIRR